MSDQSIQYQLFQETCKPFEFGEKENHPELVEGEVLIKILLSTICGSDLHTIEGKRKEDTPCILGHEAVGEIVAINSRNGFDLGDRVTWTIADSCGQCEACMEYDLPQKCTELFKYGHASIHNGSGLNGCYASHIHIRKGTHMVKLPDAVTNEMAAPANCALSTMVNAISQMKSIPKTAVIQGGGLLGIYTCGLLKEKGVEQIFCLEVNKERFSLIEAFGATVVDANDADKATNFILEQSPDGVDVVIEVAGVKELVPQGLKLLRFGGEYILAGLVHPNSQLTITAEQIIRKCIKIIGVHNYAPRHLDEAVSFLERNRDRFPFHSLVSPPYHLAELKAAVVEAQSQKWARVSVRPN